MTSFPAIRIEGGLLGADVLDQLLAAELPGQRPADFGLDGRRSLTDEIAAAFADARALWGVFRNRLRRLPDSDPATSLTRDAWVIPFLGLLGYELRYNPRSYDVDGFSFAISHRAGEPDDAPPVHIVGVRQELGRVAATGRPRLAPHSLVQEYLNRSEQLWGIVTNGLVLRLLRDSTYIRRQAYVEFDLAAILEDQHFQDFAALYRLLHRTRLPRTAAEAQDCLLEKYYQHSIEQGGRVRDRLRDGVEECLKRLANGYLRHPANLELRRRIAPDYSDPDKIKPEDLYRQLLRLVYRFLFLLVSEDRGLISPDPIYREHYGVARLRRLLDQRGAYTEHDDLWHSLRVLWKVLSDERLSSLLQVAPLNGELFAPIDLDHCAITNRELLEAFWHLAWYQETPSSPPRRVNYAALDVEELGSVYESLLEYHPHVEGFGQTPHFDLVPGSERRSTGSYYTPPELVAELVRSALDPVIEERLKGVKSSREKKQAILSIRVCDPAAGSGHFLLAAARRLGKELGRVRTGEDEPAPERVREAVRDVVAHCIYGVDKNPLAVELCRVALWLEAHCEGKPLTFLDHRIRCGDSLVGVFDLEVLQRGIPDEAFQPVSGDDRKWAASLKRRNREEREGQRTLPFDGASEVRTLGAEAQALDTIADDTPQHIREKQRRFNALQQRAERDRMACNLWTAAFFQPLRSGQPAITSAHLADHLEGQRIDGRILGLAEAMASAQRFFHWPLEFPEVFAAGGFDVVLSNPPWERIKLQEEEFFASRDREIASASTAAARKQLIRELPTRNPQLWKEYQAGLHTAECASRFLRGGGRYPLTGRGDINTYAVFAELGQRLLKPEGRAGIIVPTGIATDATTQHFFGDLVERRSLVSLYDFENRKAIFPAVHRSYKFCLLTLRGERSGGATQASPIEFAFFCHDARDLQDAGRRFTLEPEDFRLLNPNTRTAPIFRSRRDAELTKHIYRRVPVLVREASGEQRVASSQEQLSTTYHSPPATRRWLFANPNPWGVEFLAMFHMANDSHLFRTREELEREGFRLEGNVFVKEVGGEPRAVEMTPFAIRYLPLYEAKMIWHYDHRFGTYEGVEGRSSTQLPTPDDAQHADPAFLVQPWYWVPAEEVEARLGDWKRGWLLGFRNVTNATNERTAIFSVLPRVGVGNSLPLSLLGTQPAHLHSALYGNLASVVFDWVVRQKLAGVNMNFFYVQQFPVLPPSAYTPEDLAFIVPRVLELTYTAWDLAPFAADLWESADEAGRQAIRRQWEENRRGEKFFAPTGNAPPTIRHSPLPPFRWDTERRFQLRCELDACFFHLYLGTPEEWAREATPELKALFPTARDALAYILDQFPIVRRKDEERYGVYRTKETILKRYDEMHR